MSNTKKQSKKWLRHTCTAFICHPSQNVTLLPAVPVSLQRAPGASATYTQCFCGVELDDPDEFGEAVCNFECAGDASQICGGLLAISVYTFGTDGPSPTPAPLTPGQPTPTPPTPSPITPVLPTPAPTPEFLGCWTDLKGNRLMTLVQSNAVMTIEVSPSFPFFLC